jgi:hypothetical protein
MKQLQKSLLAIAVLALVIIQLAAILLATLWLYTTLSLEIAKREGVYETPEDGMRVRVTESWVDVEKVEITYAGPNSFDGSNPDVWFVIARVWAARRANGKPVHERGYDSAGSFFLHMQEGWIHVPEGRFPELIGFGMRLFGPSVEL